MGAAFLLPVVFVEAASLWFGSVNVWRSTAKDSSLGGLTVVIGYLAGWLLIPSGVHVEPLVWCLYYVGWALSAWALFVLRSSFTAGPSSFVSLVDSGPYAWVRHPQLLGKVIMSACLVGLAADMWGLWVLLSSLTVIVIVAEDRFLMRQEGYAEYASDKARLIPGVW